MMYNLAPHHMLAKSLSCSNYEQKVLGSRNGNIHPPFVLYEPDASMSVIPHAVEDNDVSFLPLESIHSVNVVLKIGENIYQKLYLSLVRRDDADAQRS